MPVLAGNIVSDKYRVERVLGEGGMGMVVAARHLALGELHAIKIMKREVLGADAYAERRFLGEARAAARLKGEHVARVHDIGRLDTGELYMVMEYLEGTDLKTLVHQRGALPVQDAVRYVQQTCEAIAEAHALDIIHRDIKPHNLFLVEGRNSIKVLDFGISKQRTTESAGLTGSNVILGTVSYMSPEQIERSKAADARSDIWSLGVVLYELVTGTLPFSGEGILETFTRISKEAPTPPSQLQPGLSPTIDAVVERCLRKNPAERFGSATELAKALGALIATTSTEAAAPIERYPVSSASSASSSRVPSAPSAASASDAHATKREPRIIAQPAPPAQPSESEAQSTLAIEARRKPSRSETRYVRTRRAWRWALGLGILACTALVSVAFMGSLPAAAPSAPRTGESPGGGPVAHAPASSKAAPGTGSNAIIPPSREGPHEPPPSPGATPPSEPAPEADPHAHAPNPAPNPRDAAHEASPGTDRRKSRPAVHKPRPATNGKPPTETTHKSTSTADDGVNSSSQGTAAPPPDVVVPSAPRTEGQSRCAAVWGSDFAVVNDLSKKKREQRSQLISQDTCKGDPANTHLCCRQPID